MPTGPTIGPGPNESATPPSLVTPNMPASPGPPMEYVTLKRASPGIRDAVYKEVLARRSLYQERDLVMHRIRRYRLMRHKPYMPKSYQRQLGGENAVKIPIMYRLVQTAVNSVAKGFPTILVEPIVPEDRRNADELGRALNLLIQSVENQAHVPFLYSLYFNLFGDGLGVTKTQRGPWSGFPLPAESEDPKDYIMRVAEYMQDNPLPFTTRVVDPLTFYPPLDEYGKGVTIESAWRSTREVLQHLHLTADMSSSGLAFHKVPIDHPWPDLEFPPGIPPTIRIDEVWSKDEVGIVIQGDRDVWVFENPTGTLPYTWGFAEPTGVHDPTNVGMSVVYPLYYLAPWIDTMAGIMSAWSLFAAPTPFTTQDPDPRIRPTMEQKIDIFQPGKMYHFPTGRKPGILQAPPVGANVLDYINFLIQAADRGGLPALVSGSDVGSRLPNLTFQAAYEAATDRLRPAVQSAEHIIAGTLYKMLEVVSDTNIPVKVNGWDYVSDPDNKQRTWAVIKPDQAKKKRQITVSLAIDSTQDQIAKGTHAQFMVSAQLWDLATAMRFAGVANVQRTKDMIAADTAWRLALPALAQAILQNDPDFQAYQAQAAAAQAQAEQGGAEGAQGAQGEQGAQGTIATPGGQESGRGATIGTENAQGGTAEAERNRARIVRPEALAGGGIITNLLGQTGNPLEIGGNPVPEPGAPPGPGRNRKGVPAGRGGGRRGIPTEHPRGNRQSQYGRK